MREPFIVKDEDGLLEEPCLSCDKCYMEDIWNEWCCDEKECPYNEEDKWIPDEPDGNYVAPGIKTIP